VSLLCFSIAVSRTTRGNRFVESVPAGADRESIGKSEVERQSVRRKSWNSLSTFASKKVCQMILKSWLVSTSSLFN
jgi:hypothetical protein